MPSEFSMINVMTINNWEIMMTARLQHTVGPKTALSLPSSEHTRVLIAPSVWHTAAPPKYSSNKDRLCQRAELSQPHS